MAPLVANFRHRTANGEGSDCERLAGGNEYIKSLQRRSIENKEANERVRRAGVLTVANLGWRKLHSYTDINIQESLNAYYMKNYPDVFAVDGKKMVKKTDGSFALYDTNDLARLTHEGRIVIEYPKSMGGRISGECRDLSWSPCCPTRKLNIGVALLASLRSPKDLTQKPIMVLRE